MKRFCSLALLFVAASNLFAEKGKTQFAFLSDMSISPRCMLARDII